MAQRHMLRGGLLVALALTGCGGSGTASNTESGSQPSAAALAALQRGVLQPHELTGFAPAGRPLLGANAKSWVEGLGIPAEAQPTELERLEKEGFVAGTLEQLAPGRVGAARGLSVVEDFRSPEAARLELSNQSEQLAKLGAKSFAVAQIPGAHGFTQRSRITVEFADGSYYYLVGARWPPGTPRPTTVAAVTAAAQSLYRRTRG